ncbi:MAG: YfaZ family outer membrane protein [Venatoribacter sp.]
MKLALMLPITAFTALASLAPAAMAGGSLDLSLNNKAFRLGYGATKVNSPMHLDADILHHSDKGDMATLGLHVVDKRPSNRDLYIGIGGKLHYVHIDGAKKNADQGAVGVGGFFRYNLPVQPDVSVAAYGYYAPPVLAVNDVDYMVNTDVRVQYAVIPTGRVFLGYRYVGLKLENANKRYALDKGLHLGLTLDF